MLTKWNICENYETKTQDLNLQDLQNTSAEIVNALNIVKSEFEDRVNALYDGYFHDLDKIAPSQEPNGYSIVGVDMVKRVLSVEQGGQIKEIFELAVLLPKNQFDEIYKKPTNEAAEKSLRHSISRLCRDAMPKLWKKMGWIDQRIKKHMIDSGWPCVNRIEMNVRATVPKDYDQRTFFAARYATWGNADKDRDGLWKKQGLLVDAKIMPEEAKKLKNDFQYLRQKFVARLQDSNELIDTCFENLTGEIEASCEKIDGIVADQTYQPRFNYSRCGWLTNTVKAFTNCLRRHLEEKAGRMNLAAERVYELATVLNYLLESKIRVPTGESKNE